MHRNLLSLSQLLLEAFNNFNRQMLPNAVAILDKDTKTISITLSNKYAALTKQESQSIADNMNGSILSTLLTFLSKP